jgi:hypothetical protein
MQLSVTVGTVAFVLCVVLATGYAIGEDSEQSPEPRAAALKQTGNTPSPNRN